MICTCHPAVCANRWATDGNPCCAACSHIHAPARGSSDREHRCHPTPAGRMLRSHLRECVGVCEGCEPCPERHCRLCGHEHVTVDGRGTDQTCGTCLAGVRDDLGEIPELTARMLYEAMTRGITSEAAMLIGPSTDPAGFARRVEHVRVGRGCRATGCPMHPEPGTPATFGPACDTCEHVTCRRVRGDWCATLAAIFGASFGADHPLYVLGAWERTVRDYLGHVQPVDLKLGECVRYLDAQLTILAHRPDFDFEALARDTKACRLHLENVLHDSQQPEKGAPCPACGRADLEHVYGDRHELVDGIIVGVDDGWQCPRAACAQWWTESQYRDRVEGTYVQVADRLTAMQIASTYRVPEGTVRRWASGKTPTVRTHGKDAHGRQLYNVADVLAMRESDTAQSGV